MTRYTIATITITAAVNIAMKDAFQTGTAECMSTGCYDHGCWCCVTGIGSVLSMVGQR